MTLDGAKQAVANYAGSYCQEFNELRNNLDDGCEVLQQVLVSDVPGPQVKLNVGQLEASKRKNFQKLVKSRCLYFKKMVFFKKSGGMIHYLEIKVGVVDFANAQGLVMF